MSAELRLFEVADCEHTRERFRTALDPLRDLLRGQSFVGGASPNYADYTVFGAFAWARGVCPFSLLQTDDLVYRWRERMPGRFSGYVAASTGFRV